MNLFFGKVCKKCGSESFGQHLLRHTFATRCIEAGVPPIVLKNWLGHKDIQITLDSYAEVFDKMNFVEKTFCTVLIDFAGLVIFWEEAFG